MIVAAVEIVGQGLIPGTVFRQGSVQQIDRNGMPEYPVDKISPGADSYATPLDVHRPNRFHPLQHRLRTPDDRLLALIPSFIQSLPEVALAVEQGEARHGNFQIGAGAPP